MTVLNERLIRQVQVMTVVISKDSGGGERKKERIKAREDERSRKIDGGTVKEQKGEVLRKGEEKGRI